MVKYIVGSFAEKKDEVEYTVTDRESDRGDKIVEITVYLSESDMGKVIGKQGKIAKAMRTLVSSTSPRGVRTIVSIKQKDAAEAETVAAAATEEQAE